jgi:thiol:disulfide interchange protein
MVTLERLLAWPLYATVAWLFWVLSRQTGTVALAACLAGLVLIAFAAWLYEATRRATAVRRTLARGATVASVIVALALTQLAPGAAARPAAAERVHGERFSTARLAELRAQGTPVFVNVTAAWCITCLVNERLVLRAPAVKESFARNGVIHLTADWTNRDPEITRMLASFDRNGVPLYLLYPRSGRGATSAEAPAVLPQILTERAVLDSLDRL